MHANDAKMMLDILSKNNKDKTGANLLSENAPSPSEIWATIVAINDKVKSLNNKIDQLRDPVAADPGQEVLAEPRS